MIWPFGEDQDGPENSPRLELGTHFAGYCQGRGGAGADERGVKADSSTQISALPTYSSAPPTIPDDG